MTSCVVCKQLTKEEFEKKVSIFRSRRDVLYFLLNTLLTIKTFGDQLCYCEQYEKRCTYFEIRGEFSGVEYDLYENMFDLNFLVVRYFHLFDYLEHLFESKLCICLIFYNKFHYFWRDWFNGENNRVSLSDTIAHKEDPDVKRLHNNNCMVQLDRL